MNKRTFLKRLSALVFGAAIGKHFPIIKPEVAATEGYETIAGWMRVTRKSITNIPVFCSWLQKRLPEILMENDQTSTNSTI